MFSNLLCIVSLLLWKVNEEIGDGLGFYTLLVYEIRFLKFRDCVFICSFLQFKPQKCDLQAHKGDKIKVHYRVSFIEASTSCLTYCLDD